MKYYHERNFIMQLINAKKFCMLLLTIAVFGVTGCAITHTPDKSALQRMTTSDARMLLKKIPPRPMGFENEAFFYPHKVVTVVVTKNIIIFVEKNGQIFSVKMNEIQNVDHANKMDMTGYHVTIYDGKLNIRLWTHDNTDFGDQVADAIYVLKEAAPEEIKKDESNFEKAVQTYRNAATKPAITEDVRKFKVQAEVAVGEKRFGDAVGFYQSALDIAPYWPEGHFNIALLLGEIGDYETAAIEMGRYLKLEPNASDARSAQNKIYEWESKFQK